MVTSNQCVVAAEAVNKIKASEGTETLGAVRDLLTELMHLCHMNALDFNERVRAASVVYVEEVHGIEEHDG